MQLDGADDEQRAAEPDVGPGPGPEGAAVGADVEEEGRGWGWKRERAVMVRPRMGWVEWSCRFSITSYDQPVGLYSGLLERRWGLGEAEEEVYLSSRHSNPYARPEPRGSDGVGEDLRAGVHADEAARREEAHGEGAEGGGN